MSVFRITIYGDVHVPVQWSL